MAQPFSPPQPPKYLDRPYPSSQKGGTLIAEDVTDLETHEKRLHDLDSYRPSCCPRCGHGRLHVHDYPWRVLRGERAPKDDAKRVEVPSIRVIRHRCANQTCKAVWRTLPALLARHLWRRWVVVDAATVGHRPHDWPEVPARTRRRWLARLLGAARVLTQALAVSGSTLWEDVAKRVGATATRLDLLGALELPLSSVAALLHRLAPGLRLM